MPLDIDTFIPFASREYLLMLGLLLFARSMDFLSTWVATPNLELEGNPVAKLLGWRWGILVNLLICFVLSFWHVTAIAISTMSVLVAARNFQSAWLMRSMGEDSYRDWHVKRIEETRVTLYLVCLAGNTLLTSAVGVAVAFYGASLREVVLFAIGWGIVIYAAVVVVFTVLALWRIRRAADTEARAQELQARLMNDALARKREFEERVLAPANTAGSDHNGH